MVAKIVASRSAVTFPTMFHGHGGSVWLVVSETHDHYTGLCIFRGQSEGDTVGKWSTKIKKNADAGNTAPRPKAVRLFMPGPSILAYVPKVLALPEAPHQDIPKFLATKHGCVILRDLEDGPASRVGVPVVMATPKCKFRDGGVVCSAKSCPHMRTATPVHSTVVLEQDT